MNPERTFVTSAEEASDQLLAVVAHGLLQPLAAAQLAVATAVENADALEKEDVVRLVNIARPHLALAVELIKDLIRGLPPDVIGELNALRRDR